MNREAIGRSIEKFVVKPAKLVKEIPVKVMLLGMGHINLVMGSVNLAHDGSARNIISIVIGSALIGGVVGTEVVDEIIFARKNKSVFSQGHQSE